MKVSKIWIYEACSWSRYFLRETRKERVRGSKNEGDDIFLFASAQVYRETEFEF